jgi:hypothetical protein
MIFQANTSSIKREELVNLDECFDKDDTTVHLINSPIKKMETVVARMRITDLTMPESLFNLSGTPPNLLIKVENILDDDVEFISKAPVSSPPMKRAKDIKLPSPHLLRESLPSSPTKLTFFSFKGHEEEIEYSNMTEGVKMKSRLPKGIRENKIDL